METTSQPVRRKLRIAKIPETPNNDKSIDDDIKDIMTDIDDLIIKIDVNANAMRNFMSKKDKIGLMPINHMRVGDVLYTTFDDSQEFHDVFYEVVRKTAKTLIVVNISQAWNTEEYALRMYISKYTDSITYKNKKSRLSFYLMTERD